MAGLTWLKAGLSAGILLSVAVQAEPLMDKLQALTALRADFTQTVLNADGKEVASAAGHLALQRPQSFMLHTTAPDELYLYTRPDGVYYYDAFINQLTIMPLDTLQRSPFALLLQDKSGTAWQDWSVKEVSAGSCYELRPQPGSAAAASGGAAAVSSLQLQFAGAYLSAVTVYFADGNCNRYTLSAQELRAEAEDFACTIPADAEVSDER